MSSKASVFVIALSVLNVCGLCGARRAGAEPQSPFAAERNWQVIEVLGEGLNALQGCPVARMTASACSGSACRPVPVQVDERDAAGRFVLDFGSEGAEDEIPGVFDRTDVLVLLASSFGEVASSSHSTEPAVRVQARDPIDGQVGEVVLSCGREPLEGSFLDQRPQYDPLAERVVLRTAEIVLHSGVPRSLRIAGSDNLLDRLKIRARATWLFGLLRLRRTEDDIQHQLLGWRAGPVRLIRVDAHWVELGFGLRTPFLRSRALFYPDAVVLPLSFRLRFPAAFFFSDITAETYADFRNLGPHTLALPSSRGAVAAARANRSELALDGLPTSRFALVSPSFSLFASLRLSNSLRSLEPRLLYHNDAELRRPPEEVPGELPGVGFALHDWKGVGSGLHTLEGTIVILPGHWDVERFFLVEENPLQVRVEPLLCCKR
jgi:hypothetical protein